MESIALGACRAAGGVEGGAIAFFAAGRSVAFPAIPRALAAEESGDVALPVNPASSAKDDNTDNPPRTSFFWAEGDDSFG
ncbi:hypothetical protein [Caballeronia sordidicola]|uniref:hypothetical protein n=1 Tax=Caballeronia sordidicola TaxID=196367 RepID=UPI001428ACFE|nr:hypothetical protein [Caballeronia sordidicola]